MGAGQVLNAAPPAPVPLAADPLLPARDELLDVAAMGPYLAGLIGVDGPLPVRGCQVRRVKYRIGESLRVTYRLLLEGGTEHLVTARQFLSADQAEREYRAALAGGVPAGPLRSVALDRDRRAVWWSFPNDRRLRAVADLIVPGVEVVEYSPERCVTLRAMDAAGTAVGYGKVYAPGTVSLAALAGRYQRAAAWLPRFGPFRAPAVLGYGPRADLLVLQPLPGRHWAQLSADRLPAAIHQLGGAIAALHRQPLDATTGSGLAGFGRLAVPRLLRSGVLVGLAVPELAATARGLAAALERSLPRPGDPVVLHGDCHPKNSLAGDAGLALIDLDQSGLGPAAADIGSLLARLRFGTLVGEHPGCLEVVLRERFLAGYAQIRALPAERDLRWHTAAALLAERAVRAVNRVQVRALPHLAAVLAAGEAALHEPVRI